jgi:hypothetical protein
MNGSKQGYGVSFTNAYGVKYFSISHNTPDSDALFDDWTLTTEPLGALPTPSRLLIEDQFHTGLGSASVITNHNDAAMDATRQYGTLANLNWKAQPGEANSWVINDAGRLTTTGNGDKQAAYLDHNFNDPDIVGEVIEFDWTSTAHATSDGDNWIVLSRGVHIDDLTNSATYLYTSAGANFSGRGADYGITIRPNGRLTVYASDGVGTPDVIVNNVLWFGDADGTAGAREADDVTDVYTFRIRTWREDGTSYIAVGYSVNGGAFTYYNITGGAVSGKPGSYIPYDDENGDYIAIEHLTANGTTVIDNFRVYGIPASGTLIMLK